MFLFFVGALAGCATPQGATEPVIAPTAAQTLAARAVADDGAGTARDGYLLEASAGPDAPLTTFSWHVPAGATQHSKDLRADVIFLELLPLREHERVDALAFVVFLIRDGHAVPVSARFDVPGKINSTNHGEKRDSVHQPTIGGLNVFLVGDEVADGDELRFVLGAKGGNLPVQYVLLVAAGNPFNEDFDYVRDVREAAKRLAAHDVRRLPVVGHGSGIWAASYTALEWPWANLTSELRMGDVEVTLQADDTAAGPKVSRTMAATFPVATGWTAGFGYDRSNGIVGRWSVQGEAHGLALHDTSPLFGASDRYLESLVSAAVGYSIYDFVAEGTGAASSTFHVEGIDRSDDYTHSFGQATLGTPLPTLVGYPGETYYNGWGAASRWLQIGPSLP